MCFMYHAMCDSEYNNVRCLLLYAIATALSKGFLFQTGDFLQDTYYTMIICDFNLMQEFTCTTFWLTLSCRIR